MKEINIIPVKYIFLDVVGFTHDQSVEAQSDIVHSLNEIVKRSLDESSITDKTESSFLQAMVYV